jgi:hypothetical protein
VIAVDIGIVYAPPSPAMILSDPALGIKYWTSAIQFNQKRNDKKYRQRQ